MTRLVDRLLEKQPRCASGYNPPDDIRDVVLRTLDAQLVEAEAFLIDNVAEYWESVGGWSKGLSPADFPNVAPPFGTFFMEHRILDDEGRSPERDARVGVLFTVLADDPDEGWTIELCPFLGSRDGPIGPVDVLYLIVNPSGGIVDFRGPRGGEDDPARTAEMVSGHWHLIAPALLAVCFLHCRNVVTEVVGPNPNIERARARRAKRPLHRYKVLRIAPMTHVLRIEGSAENTGLAKALHICRGHFKTYDRRPLFGSLKGTWWWADHVRGAISAGIVGKDYAVDAPDATIAEARAAAVRKRGTRRDG